MFRLDIENTTRKILKEMIQTGEKEFEKKMENYLGWFEVNNMKEVVKLFTNALLAALKQHSFYEIYQKLHDSEKSIMCVEIAEHFIKKYPASFLHFDFFTLTKGDMNIHCYLLEEIFWSFLTSGYAVRNEKKIQGILVEQINIPLARFMSVIHQKQLTTLALGYADKHSIFSLFPKEIVEQIEHVANAVHAQNIK